MKLRGCVLDVAGDAWAGRAHSTPVLGAESVDQRVEDGGNFGPKVAHKMLY